MSKLRPELISGDCPAVRDGTAYMMILSSIKTKKGLISGKLHDHGESCAIGAFFDVNKRAALPNDLIDEVAAVNDSVPQMTMRARKNHVARWLKWKLTQLGMTGFSPPKRRAEKAV